MTILTIGKRLVPTEHIALVETFENTNSAFKPDKNFEARLVLLNRDIVLIEATPDQFAKEHRFWLLAEDSAAINLGIFFWVETFTRNENFQPQKPYRSRLKWRDPETGGDQSRLLVTEPPTIAAMIAGQGDPAAGDVWKRSPKRPARARRKTHDPQAARTQ